MDKVSQAQVFDPVHCRTAQSSRFAHTCPNPDVTYPEFRAIIVLSVDYLLTAI
jgi:hypothetical protein